MVVILTGKCYPMLMAKYSDSKEKRCSPQRGCSAGRAITARHYKTFWRRAARRAARSISIFRAARKRSRRAPLRLEKRLSADSSRTSRGPRGAPKPSRSISRAAWRRTSKRPIFAKAAARDHRSRDSRRHGSHRQGDAGGLRGLGARDRASVGAFRVDGKQAALPRRLFSAKSKARFCSPEPTAALNRCAVPKRRCACSSNRTAGDAVGSPGEIDQTSRFRPRGAPLHRPAIGWRCGRGELWA